MVPGNGVNRHAKFRQAGPEDGILNGIGGIVHQVSRHEYIGRTQVVGRIDGSLHQGIRVRETRRRVNESDLGVAHLDEGERLESLTGRSKHQRDGQGKQLFHTVIKDTDYSGKHKVCCGVRGVRRIHVAMVSENVILGLYL